MDTPAAVVLCCHLPTYQGPFTVCREPDSGNGHPWCAAVAAYRREGWWHDFYERHNRVSNWFIPDDCGEYFASKRVLFVKHEV